MPNTRFLIAQIAAFLLFTALPRVNVLAQSGLLDKKVHKEIDNNIKAWQKAGSTEDRNQALDKFSDVFNKLIEENDEQTAEIIFLAQNLFSEKSAELNLVFFQNQYFIIPKVNELPTYTPPSKPLTMAAEMPTFPDCAEIDNPIKRISCSESALIRFFKDNVQHLNLINGTEIIIRLLIDENGKVRNPEILQSPSPDWNDKFIEVANLLNGLPNNQTIKPAKNRGKTVDVFMTIPLRF